MKFKVCFVLSLLTLASASPVERSFWDGTPLQSAVEKMRSSCAEDDTLACFQYKAFQFLDNVIQGNYFHFSDKVEVSRNGYWDNEVSSRSDNSLETGIEQFIKGHNVKFNVPVIGSVTADARNLDNEEFDLKINFGSGRAVEARKKSKLKKIFLPILVIILLKALSLVPFALGVLGLKAWNSLQLAFFSFIIATGLAIFQLCQKLAADGAHPQIAAAAPGPWDAPAVNHFAARNLENGQQMAYSGYNQN